MNEATTSRSVADHIADEDLDDVPLFGARKRARDLAAEVRQLREQRDRLGLLDVVQLEARRDELTTEIADQQERLRNEADEARAARFRAQETAQQEERELALRVRELRREVVVTEETVLLQEAGLYEYRHPLSDSVAYREELAALRERLKAATRKDGGAISATTDWTVNGSAAQGRAMVRDFSKLMLRAYNAEADVLVRALKPYKLNSAIDRLEKVVRTIERLGQTMDIEISEPYHRLRLRELELTADYQQRLAEEKEREREEKERLREERRAQQELERERGRLEKERQHYANALEALVAKGDEAGAARMREEIAGLERAIEDVDYRAANVRAGYVYVISNVGAFGDGIVKVGMTRRLDPLDRVRELGDASVPFRFDVHALFFSEDAVGIESKLHARLAEQRVNLVNLRREFFYATPLEVREHLVDLAGELLQFDEEAEAVEFHQSSKGRRQAAH